MQAKNKRILFVGVMVLLIIGFGFTMMKIIKENRACLDSPLIYGAKRAYEMNGVEMTCSCSFSDPNYAPLWFDRETMEVEDAVKIGDEYVPYNFTAENLTD